MHAMNQQRTPSCIERHILKATGVGAAMLSLLLPPAVAGTGNASVDAAVLHTNCCGYYPLVPNLERGWRDLSTTGLNYYGYSQDSWVQILAGSTARSGSVEAGAWVSANAGHGFLLRYAYADVEASWSDTVTAASSTLAIGTPVAAKLYRFAAVMDGSAHGRILGQDFRIGPGNSFFYSEQIVDNFVTVGGVTAIGTIIRTSAGLESLRDTFGSSLSHATAGYAFEFLTPEAQGTDGAGRPLPTPHNVQGLEDAIPMRPDSQQPTGDGGQTYTFPRYVIGSDRSRYFYDPPVAIGYEFKVVSGPLFSTVLLPHIGDGHYGIALWDGAVWSDIGVDVLAGESFDFRTHGMPLGIGLFRVTGVEASAAIDPAGHDFVTGFTFASSGLSVITQTSLVPEPAGWALMLAGLWLVQRASLRRKGVLPGESS